MFKKRFLGLGKLRSDEGWTVSYGHKSVRYKNDRGTFEFAFEDEILVPKPHHVKGPSSPLDPTEIWQIVDRIKRALQADGQVVRIYGAENE